MMLGDWSTLVIIACVVMVGVVVIGNQRGWFGAKGAAGVAQALKERVETAAAAVDLPGDWDDKLRAQIKAGTLDDVILERVHQLVGGAEALAKRGAAAAVEQEAKFEAWAKEQIAAIRAGRPVSSTPPVVTAAPAPTPTATVRSMVRAPGPENQPPGNWHLPPVPPAAPDPAASARTAASLPAPLPGEGLDAYAERCSLADLLPTLRTVAAIHPGFGWDQILALTLDPHSNREMVATPADRDTLAAAAADPATLQPTA